ncbi:MAG: ROK family glucokinase [Aquiluna sp.]|nr:ROK family glucokinase [Aquiluna sp.]
MLSIGIDIGGTKILGALVDEKGNVLEQIRVPSPAKNTDLMISEVASLALDLKAKADSKVAGIGVAAAGFIDADQSTVLYAPNLSWRNEPLRERLVEAINHPVIVENDANAAGWAEYRFGAGQGAKDMVMLTLGTGVGGAVVLDGAIRRGGFGIAGELGHIRVVRDGLQCGCGRRGCVEQYASGTALLLAARKLAGSGHESGAFLAGLQHNGGELTGKDVQTALEARDPGTLELLADVGQYLGEAMGTITATFDPEVFVIGGGLSEAGDLLLEPIRQSFLAELPARGFRPEAKIFAATFSNQAGVIGAADLARESLR